MLKKPSDLNAGLTATVMKEQEQLLRSKKSSFQKLNRCTTNTLDLLRRKLILFSLILKIMGLMRSVSIRYFQAFRKKQVFDCVSSVIKCELMVEDIQIKWTFRCLGKNNRTL